MDASFPADVRTTIAGAIDMRDYDAHVTQHLRPVFDNLSRVR